MSKPFFDATSINIAFCGSPKCSCVHVQLLDDDGAPQAQFCIEASCVDQVVKDMYAVRAAIQRGRTSLAKH